MFAIVDKRCHRQRERLYDAAGDVLRAQRDAPETALDTPGQRCSRWQEQKIMRLHVAESGIRQQPARSAGAKQDGIAIKFTAGYC
jgi:hypothetical protein